jgi:hypothetical protein
MWRLQTRCWTAECLTRTAESWIADPMHHGLNAKCLTGQTSAGCLTAECLAAGRQRLARVTPARRARMAPVLFSVPTECAPALPFKFHSTIDHWDSDSSESPTPLSRHDDASPLRLGFKFLQRRRASIPRRSSSSRAFRVRRCSRRRADTRGGGRGSKHGPCRTRGDAPLAERRSAHR